MKLNGGDIKAVQGDSGHAQVNSNKHALWICRNNSSHHWEASFQSRALGEGFCKICRGYRDKRTMFYEQYPKLETVVNHNFECLVCDGSIIQPGVNSLADTDPNLCLEISPNEERRPETLHKSMAICIVQKWGLRTSLSSLCPDTFQLQKSKFFIL